MALPCAIAAITAEQCGGTLGGVKRIWATEYSELTAITFTSNEVSAWTVGDFFEIGTVAQDGATYTEVMTDPTTLNGAVLFTQTVTVMLNKIDTATRIALEGLVACCKVLVVVEMGDGSRRLIGVDQTAASPYFAAPIKYMRATVYDLQGGNPGQGQMATLTLTGTTARSSAFLAPALVIPV